MLDGLNGNPSVGTAQATGGSGGGGAGFIQIYGDTVDTAGATITPTATIAPP